MNKFKPPVARVIPARNKGGSQVPTLIVMHGTVSPCVPGGALAIANFFHGEINPTSAHYTVDPSTRIQCVGDHTVAYHCGYNQNSVAIEMCMIPTTNIDTWLNEENDKKFSHDTPKIRFLFLDKNFRLMLDQAAKLTAELCLAYDIPVRFLGVPGLHKWAANGKKAQDGGITTHAKMTDAFHASVHWDPGAWPKFLFMRRVKRHVRKMKKSV